MSLTLRPQLNLFDYSSQNRVKGATYWSLKLFSTGHNDIDDIVMLIPDVSDKNVHQ